MTPEFLAGLAGVVLSLVFAYFPWVKTWFDNLKSEYKPLLNAGILLAIALAMVGLGCEPLGWVDYFECSTAGLLEAAKLWVLALVGNIATYTFGVRQFKQR
jgi:hypothetical protein